MSETPEKIEKKVVKLKLAQKPLTSDKEEMLKRFDERCKDLRDWLEHTTNGGFAIVAYDKSIDPEDRRPQIHTWANYFCTDPADAFWLPEMAKTRLYQRAHEE